MKANSIRGVLLEANKGGLGGECASLQEAKHCLSLGFPPDKVVFDSPVKTPTEVREAIDLGLHMNLDNEKEVAKMIFRKFQFTTNILQIGQVREYLSTRQDLTPSIGLRINPVVGKWYKSLSQIYSKTFIRWRQYIYDVNSYKVVQVWVALDGGDKAKTNPNLF